MAHDFFQHTVTRDKDEYSCANVQHISNNEVYFSNSPSLNILSGIPKVFLEFFKDAIVIISFIFFSQKNALFQIVSSRFFFLFNVAKLSCYSTCVRIMK